MQYSVLVDQQKSLEWGLNAQQAFLFSFLYSCPSWCSEHIQDGVVFYTLSKSKIVLELPLLTDKPDTAYRLMKQLESIGLIELSHTNKITLFRLTEKGKEWNTAYVGKISGADRKNIRGNVGKISEGMSEKSPTNQLISNQCTKDQLTNNQKDSVPARELAFERYWNAGMRKLDKKKAKAAFMRQLKESKMSAEEFGAMLEKDVQERVRRKQFGFSRLHPTTYLNGERWNDELPLHTPDGQYVGSAPEDQFEENEDGSLRL